MGHSISFTVTNNQAFCLKTVTVPGLVEHPVAKEDGKTHAAQQPATDGREYYSQ